MIIGDHRLDVIHNIELAANNRNFTTKTEIGDPQMSMEERVKLVEDFWAKQDKFKTKAEGLAGNLILQTLTQKFFGKIQVTGLDKLQHLAKGGAIVTANHFNQVDALAVNRLAQKAHHRMEIVIEDTNLKLPGFFSFIMNNMGSIPLGAKSQLHWARIHPPLEPRLQQEPLGLDFPRARDVVELSQAKKAAARSLLLRG